MHYTIMDINYVRFVDVFRYFQPILPTAFDVLFIALLSCVISLNNAKIWGYIVYFLTFLWSLCNIIYSRFFSTYLTLSAISQVNNIFDDYYVQYLKIAFRYSDILFVIGLIAFVWIMKSDVEKRITIRTIKLLIVSCSFFTFLLFASGSVSASYRKGHIALFQYESLKEMKKEASSWNNNFVYKHGVIQGQIGFFLLSRLHNRELTQQEVAQIKTYIKSKTHLFHSNGEATINRNLFFILVESYLSVTSDLTINGFEVTPNLNRLKHLQSTYYNGMVRSNIAMGESSDGQFLYMTGLLPRRSSITINDVCENSLIALPHLLKSVNPDIRSYMTIPTAPFVWRQAEMSIKYGVDSLLSVNTAYMVDDEKVFEQASSFTSDSPIFHMILTMSMHSPYDSYQGPEYDVVFPDSYSVEFCNYLKKCHYTDAQIGYYLEYLKRLGCYNNSLIVIASDHQASSWFLKMDPSELDGEYMPFYMLNVEDADKLYNGPMNQLDVFPSIIDAYGLSPIWPGLGCSIYNTNTFYNSVTEEAYEISDMIIEGDFFLLDKKMCQF